MKLNEITPGIPIARIKMVIFLLRTEEQSGSFTKSFYYVLESFFNKFSAISFNQFKDELTQ
jgi:hypothetical protein